jgi:hypothetical protein
VRGGKATVSRTGRRFGPRLLLFAFALALSACAGARNREVRDPRPENYKPDILAMLHVYLRDPTQIRDAAASEPTPVLVGTTNRYVVCLRFNAKKSGGEYAGLKQYMAIFVAGRLDQMVEAKPEQCAAADYQPFPEAEKLTR